MKKKTRKIWLLIQENHEENIVKRRKGPKRKLRIAQKNLYTKKYSLQNIQAKI